MTIEINVINGNGLPDATVSNADLPADGARVRIEGPEEINGWIDNPDYVFADSNDAYNNLRPPFGSIIEALFLADPDYIRGPMPLDHPSLPWNLVAKYRVWTPSPLTPEQRDLRVRIAADLLTARISQMGSIPDATGVQNALAIRCYEMADALLVAQHFDLKERMVRKGGGDEGL